MIFSKKHFLSKTCLAHLFLVVEALSHLSVCTSVCLLHWSVCPYVYPSVCLSVLPSVCDARGGKIEIAHFRCVCVCVYVCVRVCVCVCVCFAPLPTRPRKYCHPGLLVSRGHATLHFSMLVGRSVPPSKIFWKYHILYSVLGYCKVCRCERLFYCSFVVLQYCPCKTVRDFCLFIGD